MFPDSSIAQSFTSLADFFKEQVQLDLEGVPYTFKFDETTTSQAKKKQTVGCLCNILVKSS